MPGWRRLLFAHALCTATLPATPPSGGPDAPPTIEQLVAADSLTFPDLFLRATRARADLDHILEPQARIAVRRELARHLEATGNALSAVGHLQQALEIATALNDANELANLHLDLARCLPEANQRHLSFAHLDALDALLQTLARPDLDLASALLRAELLRKSNRDPAAIESIYQRLLRDPKHDPFAVKVHRARFTPLDQPAAARVAWNEVLLLARTHNDPAIEAEALVRLGELDHQAGDLTAAAQRFRSAAALTPHPTRSGPQWRTIIATHLAVGDTLHAGAAIARALEQTDEQINPSLASLLYQSRALLHAHAGDFAAAYQDSKHAWELRERHEATRQVAPLTRLVTPASAREISDATTLAATRAALREAELDRARLQRRQAYGIGFTGLVSAAVLGIAYAYKRRSAAALALARDNAELRAERTHWQMLRYQLNPHFLFNALSSLGGLVGTDSAKATRCIDRLAEYCHLALEGAHEDLRPLAQEVAQLHAYLDVEQAGVDDLRVAIHLPPELGDCPIPPLLLQPLVENALKHGAGTCEGPLEVRVSARRETGPTGSALLIEVANTGAWVEPANQPRRRAAIGLANVRERLARLGPPGRLDLEPRSGWVIARLSIPLREAPV